MRLKTQQLFGILAIFTMMVLVFGSAVAVDEPAVKAESGEEGEEQVDLGPPGAPGQPMRFDRVSKPAVTAVSGLIEHGATVTISGERFGHFGEFDTASGGQLKSTPKRFELGNAPVFEECTRHEVQEPLQWRDDEVIINLKHSLFLEGDSLYLFVVDENNVASPGYNLEAGPQENSQENSDRPGIPGAPVIDS